MKMSWPKEFIDKNINNLISKNEQVTASTREALSKLSSIDLVLVCIANDALVKSSDKYHQIIGMLATDARLKTDKPGEWFVTKQTPPEVRRRFGDKLECIANDDFEKAAGIEVFNAPVS